MKLRNGTILTLMTISIVMLLVLQALWLRNSYEKAFLDLRRDTNFIFRNTLTAVRDSLFAKNIRPIDTLHKTDSFQSGPEMFIRNRTDSMHLQLKSSTVQVYVSGVSDNDSILNALRPLSRQMTQATRNGRSFIIRLESDTVSIDSLENIFGMALKQAGFPIKFKLTHKHSPPNFTSFGRRMEAQRLELTSPEDQNFYDKSITLDPVRFNSVHVYNASLFSFEGFILKAISPQILFSVLLTFVIIAAFYVLYKSIRSQQRLMEMKNDFISNITHELKTPVATVSVAIEALKNFQALDNPAKTLEYLDIAQNELNRLTLMTDKILKTSVFENQQLSYQLENVDIASLLQTVLSSLKLVVEKQGALIRFEKDEGNYSISGDVEHLTNMLYNLIDNALKFSRGNTEIKISLKKSADGLILAIQDNGIGIAAEYHKKVFEKFFRVHTGDVHNTKGYGLGLSYVSSVVERHGGSIKIESEINKGSTFIIYLPQNHGQN